MKKYFLLLLCINYNLLSMGQFFTKAINYFANKSHQKHPIDAFEACELGDLESLKKFIGNNDVNTFGKTTGGNYEEGRWTLLHEACARSQIEIVKYLIEQGADINALCDFHYTPLNHAWRSPEIALFLIDKGADVTIRQRYGNTCLHDFCRNMTSDSIPVIKALLAAGAEADINIKDDIGTFYPIHNLLRISLPSNIYIEVVQLFLDYGLDINQKDKYGQTPLYYAFIHADWQLVEFMLSKGADINKTIKIPLHTSSKSLNCLKYLIESYNYDINYINQTDEAGMTALHYACRINNISKNTAYNFIYSGEYFKIIKFLVDNGADVNTKNKDSKTPLFYACQLNWFYTDVINLLISKHADINIRDYRGSSIFHLACLNVNYYPNEYSFANKKKCNNIEILVYLAKRYPELLGSVNRDNEYGLDNLSVDNFIRFIIAMDPSSDCYSQNTMNSAINRFNSLFYEIIDETKDLKYNINCVRDYCTNIIKSQDLLQLTKLVNLNIIFSPTEIATLVNQQILSDNFNEEFISALIRKISSEFNINDSTDESGNDMLSCSLSLGAKTRNISVLLMIISGLNKINISFGEEANEFIKISKKLIN